jgi:hypothetical protein
MMRQEYDFRTTMLEKIRKRAKLVTERPDVWHEFKIASFKRSRFAMAAKSIQERDELLEMCIKDNAFKGIVTYESYIMGKWGLMRSDELLKWFFFRLMKYENFVNERGRKK